MLKIRELLPLAVLTQTPSLKERNKRKKKKTERKKERKKKKQKNNSEYVSARIYKGRELQKK